MTPETAKDILNKNAPKWEGEDCVPRDQALAAMQEIADKAWGAGWLARVNATKNNGKFIDKSTFMKSLFPDTK